MQVNYDFYEDLTPEKVDVLLERLRRQWAVGSGRQTAVRKGVL
jgi:hypothetical protein